MPNDSVKKTVSIMKIKSIIYRILGWVIAIFCGFLAIAMATVIQDYIDVIGMVLFIVFTALGIKLIVSGKSKAKLLAKFDAYSKRLASDPQKSLNILASEINVPIDALIKDVNKMIVLGLFPNGFIDAKSGRLIIPNSNTNANSSESRYSADVNTDLSGEPEYVTVQCQNCGATNKIVKGSVGECEFCGSQISQ